MEKNSMIREVMLGNHKERLVQKNQARIENWFPVNLYPQKGVVLLGQIKDHPNQRFFKAPQQQTSLVLNLDREKGICETENTIYTLGKEITID